MTIHQTKNGTALTIALVGRMDTFTAPDLETALQQGLDGVESLVFDCGQLDYISSAGLRVLLIAQKRMNRQGAMKLIGVNELNMEVLEATGLTEVLTIE